jgi:hypothetical protein
MGMKQGLEAARTSNKFERILVRSESAALIDYEATLLFLLGSEVK